MQDILESAIIKAIENGWSVIGVEIEKGRLIHRTDKVQPYLMKFTLVHLIETGMYKGIIYDHDFAKAIWGEFGQFTTQRMLLTGIEEEKQKLWEYNLQQMVVAENDLVYLAQSLEIPY